MDTGGQGKSIINYVIEEAEGKETVERMIVGKNIKSDHHPLAIWFKVWKDKEDKQNMGKVGKKRKIAWRVEGKKLEKK